LTHLTGFSPLPARHALRRGLVDHKGGITTSGGREKPAFGGSKPTSFGIIGFERRVAIAFTVDAERVTILRIFYGGRSWEADMS